MAFDDGLARLGFSNLCRLNAHELSSLEAAAFYSNHKFVKATVIDDGGRMIIFASDVTICEQRPLPQIHTILFLNFILRT